ncbi:MAG: trigger factor [Sphingomonadales bacterium]|nr:trigger factor [Sphingomonadales bacterium]
MAIVETTNEGLKRAYQVTIPAQDIAARVDGEVRRMAPSARMPGFRPGKVPPNLLKKMHGPALMQEALQTSIREAMDSLIRDRQLRPATQPDVALGEGYKDGADAELSVALEVLPAIAVPDLAGLALEKLVVPVSEAEVDEAVTRIASSSKRFADAAQGHVAAEGDQIVVDFLGMIDGVAFEGGKAEDAAIELGAGRFIPGFEEQLTGVSAGDERQIAVTFPADYPAAHLAGKEARFDVTVKAVKTAAETAIDDDFAKNLGLTDLEQLRGLLRGQLEQESAGQTRTQMKRALLDKLAAEHSFEVPQGMVEAEFAQIWQQLVEETKREADPAAAMAEIEAEKGDYRAIAERRVRLGLLLSEIGQANGIEITQQEMSTLVSRAAQQYRPEDRQRFADYIAQDAMAAAQLRAPMYEEKVVDFLFGKAEVTTREVTAEELQAAIEAEDGAIGHVHGPDCDHDHDHHHGHDHGAAKKPAAKKAKSEPAAEDAAVQPAKKAKVKPAGTPAVEEAAAAEAGASPARKPAAKKARPAEAEDVPAEAAKPKRAKKAVAADGA